MIFDSFFLIVDTMNLGMELSEFDKIILAHHVLTSLYMTSCRVVKAGHMSAMILMLTGEITNPLMNGMFITRFAIQMDCCNSERMLLLHTILEHVFAVVYVIFRTFIGPICAVHLTWDLLFTKGGRQNVPLFLSLVWVPLVWAVLYGSIPFVLDAVDMIRDGWELKYHTEYDYGERFQIRPDEL